MLGLSGQRPPLLRIQFDQRSRKTHDALGVNSTEFHPNALAAIEQPPQMKAGQRIFRMHANQRGECRHGALIARIELGKGFRIFTGCGRCE
jgi:hypothetical protein